MRAFLIGVAGVLIVTFPAQASQVTARDGRFEAQVSSSEMSRISIIGEKITSVRKVSDAQGPQMIVEAEAGTGDVFVAFDGEVVGRSFSVFLVTESGKTLQAVLRPQATEAQTVLVRLTGQDAGPAAPAKPVNRPEGAEAEGDRSNPSGPGRREGHAETLVALVRLMFNGEAPAGVVRTRLVEAGSRAGQLEMRPLETYTVGGLKGTVFVVQNLGKTDAALDAATFMIDGVMASAVSHETLAPGQAARLYIVEAER